MNERELEPDGTGSPEQIADELFVHGLIRAAESQDATHERIAAVMAAIGNAKPSSPHRRWRWLAAIAAAALVAAAAWLLLHNEPSGRDLWAAALRSTERASDRRYQIRAAWSGGDIGIELQGVLDVRDAGHYVFRTEVEGARVVVGADGGDMWLAGDERFVRHLRAHPPGRGPFPLDRGSIAFGSVDAFFAAVPESYELRVADDASERSVHVVAERVGSGPLPARVDAWLDPTSHVMHRVELFWSEDPASAPTGHHHMELVLNPSGAFPADWFRPERHR